MSRFRQLFLAILLFSSLAACSVLDGAGEQGRSGAGGSEQVVSAAGDVITEPTQSAEPLPTFTPTPTPTATLTPTPTPSPTAIPVIKPDNVAVQRLAGFGDGNLGAEMIQHPLFGPIFVLDELILDTPFQISWTDDNPESAVLRFRNEDDVLVERKANVDPDRGELRIIENQEQDAGALKRYQFTLNSADIFPVHMAIERLVTLELADQDGHATTAQILFSKNDYLAGYTGPMALVRPQYDQLELGIDWHSEHYAPQGALAEWINAHPELWNRVTVQIAGEEPLTWRQIREDETLLHEKLAAAAYEDDITFTYKTADGQIQQFARDKVPYYTKFAIIHSPSDEQEFYALRAGRDPGVTEEMLQEMAAVVRHMFSNRPNYLHELAMNKGVHSVAPGKDMLVLPEIKILGDAITDVIIDNEDFGSATGVALLDRHPEISASAAYYFENDTPVLGFTLMHEVIHQVQYMIYGVNWSDALIRYYLNYMDLPRRERIPNIDYYETSPWEWDALLTPAWFSQGSDLYTYVEPYLDLQVSDTGTTIRSHLQMRWGDALPVYEGD